MIPERETALQRWEQAAKNQQVTEAHPSTERNCEISII